MTKRGVVEWRSLTRVDAVLRVLREAGAPLGAADIKTVLHKAGRDDRPAPVAATLGYLKRRGRVSHEGIGQWTAYTEHPEVSPPTDGGGPP